MQKENTKVYEDSHDASLDDLMEEVAEELENFEHELVIHINNVNNGKLESKQKNAKAKALEHLNKAINILNEIRDGVNSE